MTTATAVYRAIMVEVERRRQQVGWPMWYLDDAAGTQDHYYSKALWPDGPNGRQMRWDTLQLIIDALFPEGFDVVLKPKSGPHMSALEQRAKVRHAAAISDRKLQRELMSELGRKGGTTPRRKLPGWKRKAIARKAAAGRWKRWRERQAALALPADRPTQPPRRAPGPSSA